MANEKNGQDHRLHILFISPTLTGGGAERVFITLLRHFDRQRFRLTLAVVDTRNAVFLKDVPPDVAVIDLECRRVRYALGKLLRVIWKLRPDAVFSALNHLNVGLTMTQAVIFGHASQTFLFAGKSRVHERRGPRKLLMQLCGAFFSWTLHDTGRRFHLSVGAAKEKQNSAKNRPRTNVSNGTVIHNPVDIQRLRRAFRARPYRK